MLARVYWIGRGDITLWNLEALERAVSLNPQFGYGHLQLAFSSTPRSVSSTRKHEAAAERAVDLQERYISGEEGLLIVGAHTRLGYVAATGRGRYAEAISDYQAELLFLTAVRPRAEGARRPIELHQKMGAA